MCQKLIKDKDAAIILETGSNRKNKVRNVLDEYETTTQNEMPEIDNNKEQYQHCGSGTAVIQKRGIRWQPARNLFNHAKQVTQLMNIKKNNITLNFLISGIQALNGISEGKWDDIKVTMNKIDQQY